MTTQTPNTFSDWVRCALPKCGQQFPYWALNYHMETIHGITDKEKESIK